MKIELTPQQKNEQIAFKAFVHQEIVPYANQFDREERIPPEFIQKFAQAGYLGAGLPKEIGGQGMDAISYGLLNQEIGQGCSSLRSLLTVHGMVSQALLKWGSKSQKELWLPQLASAQVIAAFALTEPNVGSDAKCIETIAIATSDFYVLNGQKQWITFGQIADLFLVFAQCEGKPTAFLVPSHSPGLSIKPIVGMLGVRASMLAELHFNQCQIPRDHLVGKVGFGFSHVAAIALDYGRYSVAWGCVGIAQACLEACIQYTNQRQQFGTYLKNHQLIQQMITDMLVNTEAAKLLCYQAGYLKNIGDPKAILETSIAKYFAAKVANQAASNAVQIHGANGCSSEYSVQRYLRDAKIMEIIEGSTQIQQIMIANSAYQEYGF